MYLTNLAMAVYLWVGATGQAFDHQKIGRLSILTRIVSFGSVTPSDSRLKKSIKVGPTASALPGIDSSLSGIYRAPRITVASAVAALRVCSVADLVIIIDIPKKYDEEDPHVCVPPMTGQWENCWSSPISACVVETTSTSTWTSGSVKMPRGSQLKMYIFCPAYGASLASLPMWASRNSVALAVRRLISTFSRRSASARRRDGVRERRRGHERQRTLRYYQNMRRPGGARRLDTGRPCRTGFGCAGSRGWRPFPGCPSYCRLGRVGGAQSELPCAASSVGRQEVSGRLSSAQPPGSRSTRGFIIHRSAMLPTSRARFPLLGLSSTMLEALSGSALTGANKTRCLHAEGIH
jgi:hypothetical protein